MLEEEEGRRRAPPSSLPPLPYLQGRFFTPARGGIGIGRGEVVVEEEEEEGRRPRKEGSGRWGSRRRRPDGIEKEEGRQRPVGIEKVLDMCT